MRASLVRLWLWVSLVVPGTSLLFAQEFEQAPIEYSKREPKNRVTKLIAEIKAGRTTLTAEPRTGYLRSLLAALEVPESSQMLVFSKTSLQRQRIAPDTPRALYFNDDTYVGFCQDGEVLELSVVDNELGSVFYTVDQDVHATDRFARHTDNCLICHGSSATKGVPGHVVRSVYSDADGLPILSSGTFRIDHTSPLKNRWGGWYVTGTHGKQTHLGNLVIRNKQDPEKADNSQGQNVTDLSKLFDTSCYLTPHSDIVALMVLEHQVDLHNYITQANFGTRQAVHYELSLNRELGKPLTERWDSTKSRIKSSCEPLVEYMFFCEEAPLTHKITGTSKFAAEFAQRGPRDSKGRSLRELDLETRMFKYPCSYLVYSESFATLPAEAKSYVFRRMREVLTAPEPEKKFQHLSDADRVAIREILHETLPGFAE